MAASLQPGISGVSRPINVSGHGSSQKKKGLKILQNSLRLTAPGSKPGSYVIKSQYIAKCIILVFEIVIYDE